MESHEIRALMLLVVDLRYAAVAGVAVAVAVAVGCTILLCR